ncbi:MAG: 4a-hydroxytetrahydrobiopterin dehydratase [Candidatus Pelagibacter sp.]|nr:4a-hydroxytetrahydrobiopterin dehydratase [Candidatus Pelagibacter sp.]
MSKKLSQINCEACREGAPVLNEKEIDDLLPQIPSWNVIEQEGIKRLICSFAFLSYQDSLKFTNQVAKLAEEEDHHPEIVLEWGRVTVTWWSHKIKGLHKNDFICAYKTDSLFKNLQ